MDTLFLIYLLCFGVGLFFAVICAFLAEMHGGHEIHMESGDAPGHVEAGGVDAHGFAAVSPTTIMAFITAFGGLGMIFNTIPATHSVWISSPLSAAGALGFAALVFMMFGALFRKTQCSSEGKVSDLLGTPATVITPITNNGVGEIAYVQSGTRYTAPAREISGRPVPSGQTVTIVRLVGSQFFVVLP